ncbi:MAG: hypothetical protein EZS28_031141 [Streblomastix strix]|uniref:RNase H type-1 domain-containing protein n=1 Tax=Streblomastix strix TaxID=222440 RepID=A0A5J4USJ9_9EUKA|nr:MAG: hypothetical protein EZS28_031141 [Streblomastix strix]
MTMPFGISTAPRFFTKIMSLVLKPRESIKRYNIHHKLVLRAGANDQLQKVILSSNTNTGLPRYPLGFETDASISLSKENGQYPRINRKLVGCQSADLSGQITGIIGGAALGYPFCQSTDIGQNSKDELNQGKSSIYERLGRETICRGDESDKIGTALVEKCNSVTNANKPQFLQPRQLQAVLKTLQIAFRRRILRQKQDVNLISDSTTVVAILNKHTTIFSLLDTLIPILQILEENKCRIRSNHILRVDNIRADELSRFKDSLDLQLQPELFKEICLEFRIKTEVDLFASTNNKQITHFYSRILEAQSEGVDAMMQDWSQYKIIYAFLPPIAIMETLFKIKRDKVTALLILPQRPAQIWIPVFQSMTITHRKSLGSFQLITIKRLAFKLSGSQIPQGQVEAIVVTPENPKYSQY